MNRRVGVSILAAAALAVGAGLALRSTKPPADGVRQRGENHWAVPSRERDRYLSDAARVNGHLAMKPLPGESPDSVRELLLQRVDPGSPVYRAGLREGDRILRVNGTPVSTLSRAVNLIHEVRNAPTLSVEIGRGTETLRVRVDFD